MAPQKSKRRVISLYDKQNRRKYLNPTELNRFLLAAQEFPLEQRVFAQTLAYTGCRLSEARNLRLRDLQLERQTLSIFTLKRRAEHVVREVPIQRRLVQGILSLGKDPDDLLWSHIDRPVPRITAYRWIKAIMKAAGIKGPQACPKGLRHGFGVLSVLTKVQLHMLQLWLGHADMEMTAVYATVMGPEQLELSNRMWQYTGLTLTDVFENAPEELTIVSQMQKVMKRRAQLEEEEAVLVELLQQNLARIQ